MLTERVSRRIFWIEATLLVLPTVLVCGYSSVIICLIAVVEAFRSGAETYEGILLIFGLIGLLACISGGYLSWVFLRSGSLALVLANSCWWLFAYSGLICTFVLFPSLSQYFYPTPSFISKIQQIYLTGTLAVIPLLHLTLEKLLRSGNNIPV